MCRVGVATLYIPSYLGVGTKVSLLGNFMSLDARDSFGPTRDKFLSLLGTKTNPPFIVRRKMSLHVSLLVSPLGTFIGDIKFPTWDTKFLGTLLSQPK